MPGFTHTSPRTTGSPGCSGRPGSNRSVPTVESLSGCWSGPAHAPQLYMTRFNSSGLSNPYIHAAKVRRARSSRSSTGFFHCRIGTRGDVHSPSIRSVLTQSSSGLSNPHVQHTSLPGLSNPHVQKLYISVRVALASRISPVATCRLAAPRNVCHCFHARSKLQPAHRMSAGWAVQPDAAGLSNPHIQTRAVQPILLRGWRV